MSEAILVRAGNVTKNYVDTQLALKVNVADVGTAAACDTGTSQGNVPVLDSNGKLNTSVLPALAITDTFTAASEAAMLALSAEKGDVCVRTDESKTYILADAPASTLANWKEIVSPADAVTSVNGKTGVVILDYSDVGAVEANTAITGATKCKITYDAKGLVTAGADLSASDIPDISATYETVSNKSDSYSASSSTTYASTKALVDGLATKAAVTTLTATIGTTWTQGASGEYSQTVNVTGLLATDTPTIDIVLSDTVSTAKSQIEAYSCVSRITTADGAMTVYCYDTEPTVAMNVQLLCVR